MDLVSWTFSSQITDVDKPVRPKRSMFMTLCYAKVFQLLIDASNPSRSVTFNQLQTLVRRLTSGLTVVGIKPGDCVCVYSFNDVSTFAFPYLRALLTAMKILYNALYLSIIGAGARFTGVNPAYTIHELVHHMQLTKPKLLIVEPKLLEVARVAAKECGLPRTHIYVFDVRDKNTSKDLLSWNELLQHGERDWVKVDDPATTIASYASTSGTSGLPKAAMLSHSYHVSQAALRCESSLPYEVCRFEHPIP